MGYFKPMRPKIGVLTLVMACVFAGGWVRSFTLTDAIFWDPDAFGFGVAATDSNFIVMIATSDHSFKWPLPQVGSSGFESLEDSCVTLLGDGTLLVFDLANIKILPHHNSLASWPFLFGPSSSR